LRIRTNSAVFAGIWSNFRPTGEYPAYVLSRVKQIQHCKFANRIWYWDTLGDVKYMCQNMRHGLLIHGKAAAFVCISSTFRCTWKAGVHICMANWSMHIYQSQWQLSLSSWCWVHLSEYESQAHLIVEKPLLLLADKRSSGALESPGHIVITDPAQHIYPTSLAIKSV
jgi:hypothetical protein